MTKIAAGIVLYNADKERLKENLDIVFEQIDQLFLVDNASRNIEEIKDIWKDFNNCELVINKKNVGIAEALNQIMAMAEAEGYQWVLTLDDDSVCDRNMMTTLCQYLKEERVGIICPRAVDDKMQQFSNSKSGKNPKKESSICPCLTEVNDCITAGSLTNVTVWREIGGFDSRLFIDFVDIEYCHRLKMAGYRILQATNTFVHQQYGNITGSFSILGKKIYLFGYSPTRIYYSVRNQIYYIKKHKKTICVWKQMLFLAGYVSKRLIFEKQRKNSFLAVCRGIKDGIKM